MQQDSDASGFDEADTHFPLGRGQSYLWSYMLVSTDGPPVPSQEYAEDIPTPREAFFVQHPPAPPVSSRRLVTAMLLVHYIACPAAFRPECF